jgi:hypothetical protein
VCVGRGGGGEGDVVCSAWGWEERGGRRRERGSAAMIRDNTQSRAGI